MNARAFVGKLLYGALFVVALPAALAAWARAIEPVMQAPPVLEPTLGKLLVALGAALVLGGWHALWFHGEGLPMNAFPPPKLVTRGVFALAPHPIYLGFCLGLFGLAMWIGSAAIFWCIAPIVSLAALALLFGYELRSLEARFGADRPRPWLSLPRGEGAPGLAERLSVFGTLLVPWALFYESVTRLGPPRGAVSTYLGFEASMPLFTASYPFYASAYLVAIAVPFVVHERAALRAYVARGWVACLVVFPLFWFLPFVAEPRPLPEGAVFAELVEAERQLDSARGALPSFHVIFAMLAAGALEASWPRWRWVSRAWALGVAASCLGVGMHGIVDVLAGFAVGAAAIRYERAWQRLRALSERIAGSWREWRFGGLRVIVHAVWAALSTATGAAIVCALLGPGAAWPVVIATLAGLVGAALWAQWIEGSPSLLRPYGFYGGLLGTTLGCLAAPSFGVPLWSMLAAFAVAGPWVQALGRLRCLVQGCCHGAPCSAEFGIVYTHPRSRVVRLSPYAGQPVHPTPLHSILANALAALVLARLWFIGMPAPFVAGSFLVLNGLARFVEEAYRGETQTPVAQGLRLYQWIASGGVIVGAALTTLPSEASTGSWQPWWGALGVAAVLGAVVGAALGVDFPTSNRRFSRLV